MVTKGIEKQLERKKQNLSFRLFWLYSLALFVVPVAILYSYFHFYFSATWNFLEFQVSELNSLLAEERSENLLALDLKREEQKLEQSVTEKKLEKNTEGNIEKNTVQTDILQKNIPQEENPIREIFLSIQPIQQRLSFVILLLFCTFFGFAWIIFRRAKRKYSLLNHFVQELAKGAYFKEVIPQAKKEWNKKEESQKNKKEKQKHYSEFKDFFSKETQDIISKVQEENWLGYRLLKKDLLEQKTPQIPNLKVILQSQDYGKYCSYVQVAEKQWAFFLLKPSKEKTQMDLFLRSYLHFFFLQKFRVNPNLENFMNTLDEKLFEVLSQVNWLLRAFCGVLDLENYELSFVNAGFHSALWIRSAGTFVQNLKSQQPSFLGQDRLFSEDTIQLELGDRLIFCSQSLHSQEKNSSFVLPEDSYKKAEGDNSLEKRKTFEPSLFLELL